MNNDRPRSWLPPRSEEAEDLHQRQLAACGTETLLETGSYVDDVWVIRVCPVCQKMASELGGGRRGCGIHGVADYDFIRVLVKTVAERPEEATVPEVVLEAAPRARPSLLSEGLGPGNLP